MSRAGVLLVFLFATNARAEEPPKLSLSEFLGEVARANLEVQAQRFDVSIAEAQVETAKAFPDWSLTGGLGSYDLSQSGDPTTATVSIEAPLEVAGKRGKRVDAALKQVKVSEATFADAMRTLRRDAASDFVDAIHARLVRDRKRQTLDGLNKLVAYNQEALRVGQVGEVALVQSRVEAKKFEVELQNAEAAVRQADLQLALRMGRDGRKPLPGTPTANLKAPAHPFELEKLVAEATAHRPDIVSARGNVDALKAELDVTSNSHWTDLTVGAGYVHGYPGTPPNYPAAAFNTISLTLGVNLPTSRLFYQGDVSAAEVAHQKAQATAKATQHAAEIEIETALDRYRAAEDAVARYDNGILADSEKVLSSNFYNYQRGGISQLEVIAAQRDLDGVYLAYDDALQERAKALVAVEQAADVWDLQL